MSTAISTVSRMRFRGCRLLTLAFVAAAAAAPVAFSQQVIGWGDQSQSIRLYGTTPAYATVLDRGVDSGRYLSDYDVLRKRRITADTALLNTSNAEIGTSMTSDIVTDVNNVHEMTALLQKPLQALKIEIRHALEDRTGNIGPESHVDHNVFHASDC